MAECKLIKAADRTFKKLGGDPGEILVARDVSTDDSTTIGCGVVSFENCSMPWTVKYDEYFYCLDGVMTIKTKDGDFVMEPGDGLWLPDGTELVYEAGAKATLVVAVYPVDWQQRQAGG